MINAIIAILVCKKVLTEDEGKGIAKKISFAVLPHDFDTSLEMVKGFLEEIEQGK